MATVSQHRVRSFYPWVLLLVGAAAVAGPISPPAGPVAPTGKTIGESEPRVLISSLPITISQSGSYYLGADLQGSGGITITASDVTIDMAGFSVDAAPVAAGDGIRTSVAVENISIFNGSVSGWPGDGVDLGSASNSLLQDMASNDNTLNGFVVGPGTTMIRCVASGNGGSGIGGSDNGKVIESTSTGNGSNGISLGDYSTVSGSISSQNGNVGVSVGDGASISDTSSSQNKRGFSAKDGGVLVNCSALSNNGDGFEVGTSVEIRSCNATGNTSTGMVVGRSSSVLDSMAGFNGKHGIVLADGAAARGNSCRENFEHGIAVEDGTVGATIERNQVFNNKGVGIDVRGGRCLIFGNVASANGLDYSLRSDSSFGVITDVIGDGAFNVTNSFANLRY